MKTLKISLLAFGVVISMNEVAVAASHASVIKTLDLQYQDNASMLNSFVELNNGFNYKNNLNSNWDFSGLNIPSTIDQIPQKLQWLKTLEQPNTSENQFPHYAPTYSFFSGIRYGQINIAQYNWARRSNQSASYARGSVLGDVTNLIRWDVQVPSYQSFPYKNSWGKLYGIAKTDQTSAAYQSEYYNDFSYIVGRSSTQEPTNVKVWADRYPYTIRVKGEERAGSYQYGQSNFQGFPLHRKGFTALGDWYPWYMAHQPVPSLNYSVAWSPPSGASMQSPEGSNLIDWKDYTSKRGVGFSDWNKLGKGHMWYPKLIESNAYIVGTGVLNTENYWEGRHILSSGDQLFTDLRHHSNHLPYFNRNTTTVVLEPEVKATLISPTRKQLDTLRTSGAYGKIKTVYESTGARSKPLHK